jgi:hypothetical protein
MSSLAVRGGSFQDLRWKGVQPDEDPDLGIGLSWEGGGQVEKLEYRLTWFEDWKRLVVRRISVEQGGRLVFEATWRPSPEERSAAELTYETRASENASPVPWRMGFTGLRPTSSSHALLPVFDRLHELDNQVQWLMATRRIDGRIYPYPPSPRWRMDSDGGDAPSVLAGTLGRLAQVSPWYEQVLRRRLRVQDLPPDRFRLMLQHIDKAALETDLLENGEGSIQVLPVLTALALTQNKEGPRILAIEEPESHLHPSLQRALAGHICDVAAKSPSSRIVLETHSEHLLLGVQLQILQGWLPPEDVLVYWVHQLENGESVADPVTFDENARPQGGWPLGVFAEDTEMAREIVQARRELAQA